MEQRINSSREKIKINKIFELGVVSFFVTLQLLRKFDNYEIHTFKFKIIKSCTIA